MRACACGERRNAARAWPGSETSSVKRPAPLRSASSSTLRTALPLPKRAWLTSSLPFSGQTIRLELHRLHRAPEHHEATRAPREAVFRKLEQKSAAEARQ